MRLSVPYAVHYYSEDRGGGRRRRYRGVVDVDVREAGNAEAPVALTWMSGGFSRANPDRAGVQEVRVYGGDGSVYEPVLTTMTNAMAPLPATQDGPMLALSNDLRSTEANRAITGASDIRTPLPKRPSEKLAIAQKDAEAKAYQYAREQLLVVNGGIWARSAMPLLVVRKAKSSGPHGAYLSFMAPESMNSGDWPNAFAPTDRAEAEAEALAMANEKHPDATFGLGAGVRNLTIVDPSLCHFDLSDIHRRNLMFAFSNASAKHLPFGTPDLAIAYDRIRTTLDSRESAPAREELMIQDCLEAYRACQGPDVSRLERMVARMRALSHTPERLPSLPGL